MDPFDQNETHFWQKSKGEYFVKIAKETQMGKTKDELGEKQFLL